MGGRLKMSKIIPLTQGKNAIVDDEDFDFLNQHKWYARNNGKGTFYAVRRYRCKPNYKEIKTVRMHRLIMNVRNGMEVDHINGNTLDNRRCNLRIVNRRENCQNMHIKSTSKYPGVSWRKDIKKWHAEIYFEGKNRHLGFFENEKEAYNTYKKACREIEENGELNVRN